MSMQVSALAGETGEPREERVPDDLLSVEETAREFNMSVDNVRSLYKKGLVGYYKVGGFWIRLSRAEVARFLEERARVTRVEPRQREERGESNDT